VACLDEGGRKRARDVAQPADFDERRGLGREKENLQGRGVAAGVAAAGRGVRFAAFFGFFVGAAGAGVLTGDTEGAVVGGGLAAGVAPGVGTVTVSTVLTRPVGASSVGRGGGPGAKRLPSMGAGG
jgi:hypothetical protein